MGIARIKYQNREIYGIVNDQEFLEMNVQRNDFGIENFLFDQNFNFAGNGNSLDLSTINFEWLPPIARPGKIICIGRNYLAHSQEQGKSVEEVPLLFSKYPTGMIGHNSEIPYPSHSEAFDYEVELAIVIGKQATKLREDENPYKYIFGFTVANDLTARDVQKSEKQWTRGKAFDNSLPIGPTIIRLEEVENPQNLDIWLTVDGENRQLSSTSKMIFDIPYLVRYISQVITLEPGDLILTGTPEGVGMYMNPPKTLRVGQQVACGVTGIGELRFKIVQ